MTQELLDCLQGETASPAAPCGGSASETEEAGSASIPAQAQGASPAGEAGRPAAAPGGGGAEEGNPLPAEADRAEKAEKGFDAYPNVVRFVAEGYPHDWSAMRVLFHDFAQRLFK